MSDSRFMEQASILVAEATTMRDGIKVALSTGFHRIQAEGDNHITIKTRLMQISTAWQISSILHDIKSMISNYESISFLDIYREGNTTANWMTKYGSSVRCTSPFIFLYPPCWNFLFILIGDNLVRILARRAT